MVIMMLPLLLLRKDETQWLCGCGMGRRCWEEAMRVGEEGDEVGEVMQT